MALLVRGLATPKTPAPVAIAAPPPPEKPMAQVLVAKRNLPVGTRLTQEDLGWQPWPLEALNPTLITDGSAPTGGDTPKTIKAAVEETAAMAAKATKDLIAPQNAMLAFVGAIVKDSIAIGEPLTAAKVIRAGDSNYMAVVVAPGMRAISIPISAETSVGGFILPGDRVDVIQSRAGPDGKSYETQTLMRNVRILAIDQKSLADKGATAMVGAVAVLEIPAEDVDIISRGKMLGEMQLALRSYTDIGGGPSPGARKSLLPPPPQTLTVYRGGQASEVVVR
jgi:pilus assembly protein CpaB